MDIQGLGYVGIRAKSLEDWTSFGTRFLGMQLIDTGDKRLALRMDDRKQRVVVNEDGGDGVAFFGWEVVDAPTLDRFATRRAARGRSRTSDGSRISSSSTTRSATASKFFMVPRPRPSRSSRAARSPASAPARSAWVMRCCT